MVLCMVLCKPLVYIGHTYVQDNKINNVECIKISKFQKSVKYTKVATAHSRHTSLSFPFS